MPSAALAGATAPPRTAAEVAPPEHRPYAGLVSDTPDVHLNLNVRGMANSATVSINERSNALLAQGRDIVKLGLGQSPFPVPAPVVRALQANAHQKDYLPVRGLPALRKAVADYHRRGDGIDREGDDVIIGPGSKELMFLLQLVFYGDLVIPTPSWVSYAPQARIIGRQVRLLPTRAEDDWRLLPEGLEALCREDPGRPRIVILNYPSNPTGGTYTVDELQELAAVARKHRVVLLSDEIYGELHHTGQHVSIARFYPEGTIVSSGLSKWCGAGGWRLGTFMFPRQMHWLLAAMASVASETFTSTCAPVQYAAVEAFVGNPELDEYLVRSRRVLRAIGRYVAQRLRAAGIACQDPAGGFYLFPSFHAHRDRLRARGIDTSPEMVARLLDETGVAVLPGTDFGRPPGELTCRLAYVDFDGDMALSHATAGANLNEAALRRLSPRIVNALDRIGEWARMEPARLTAVSG
ncbi:MAG: aminotransferase class I/II-fold pyridoxal phosphate-dependent enzyme [Myxococcales bacterium FL481]|nr:MAG: aminotransferase class I/II-fold pyridoxal phosphate-dependent enzyme [Myxococcales bacterium FL481]